MFSMYRGVLYIERDFTKLITAWIMISIRILLHKNKTNNILLILEGVS